MDNKKIVCLGGGIGTANLLRGLKKHYKNITVIVAMTDDGGSAGRLRRFYRIPPPGDLVSCIASLSNEDKIMKDLLTFRFPGDRYGADGDLPGHKFGNLMLVALTAIMGDFGKAVSEMQKIFKVTGRIFPSSSESVSIWAVTSTGQKVEREENIDLGRFTGKIEQLYLRPENPSGPKEVVEAILDADVIIGGPGDLYTTVLPVLLVPDIIKAIDKSQAKKIFIVNVANKSFETPSYEIKDFVTALVKHCKSKVFDYFLINNNTSPKIPQKFSRQYDYVKSDNAEVNSGVKIVKQDLVDEKFPLYHDSNKLAKTLTEII